MRTIAAVLQSIAKQTTSASTEDELEKLFLELYERLGYRAIGRDIQAKRSQRSGIPDVLLLNGDDSIHVVVELKRPTEPLEPHEGQVSRYLEDLHAPFALLTNGREFRRFDYRPDRPIEKSRIELGDLRGAPRFFEPLQKQDVDFANVTSIRARLAELTLRRTPLKSVDDVASLHFLSTFGLSPGSAFFDLVVAFRELFEASESNDRVLQGCYEFWKKAFAADIKEEDVPANWRPLVGGPSTEAVPRVMFCLETAYTVAARLILAKTLEDHLPAEEGAQVFGEKFSLFYRNHIDQFAFRGQRLAPSAWVRTTAQLFDRYEQEAFASVYARDLFDWWRGLPETEPLLDRLGSALARVVFALAGFNFAALDGDLLGELYQRYFDPETRKALGEFYTPPAVVEFILDQVGYEGKGRLLDPATGSGTFLIHALRRHLKANAHRDPVDVLRGLTESYELAGFDVNPFAVLMAELNFAAELIPLFVQAVKKNPSLKLRRLPIVRTDSLRMEVIEEEHQHGRQTGLSLGAEDITVQMHLPVKTATGPLPIKVKFVRLETAKKKGLVTNERQWIGALQATFDAVRALLSQHDSGRLFAEVMARIGAEFPKPNELSLLLLPYAQQILETLWRLRDEYGDGPFLKSLEDLMLGLVLKHYLQYQYVVGNPPYVRIQNLADWQKQYWETNYAWAEGNFDIYVPFIERALASEHSPPWLKEGGRLGYITPNRLMQINYASRLRQELPKVARVISITDFGAVTFRPNDEGRADLLFREATVYPAITICERTESPAAYRFAAARFLPVRTPIALDEALAAVRAGLKASAASSDDAPRETYATSGGTVTKYLEAFEADRAWLEPGGWHLMPRDERRVYEKLHRLSARIDERTRLTAVLQNYSTTSSGAFQGIATGSDGVFVLQTMAGGHSPSQRLMRSKGEAEPVLVESEGLRAFLFGRNVDRWYVGWDGWYVIFPYEWVDKELVFMPTSSVKSRPPPPAQNSKSITREVSVFDRKYPHVWKYLQRHEKELRDRERGRYRVNKPDGWRWYDLARPQNLEAGAQTKIVWQLNAQRAKFAFEGEGNVYFQAGGKGGGVYGLLIDKRFDPWVFLGLLNSSVLDFLVRETSSIYMGGSASYADAFVKDLPIADPESKEAKRIAQLARTLTERTRALRSIETKIEQFPDSCTEDRRSSDSVPELDTPQRLLVIEGKLGSQIAADHVIRPADDRDRMQIGRASLRGDPMLIEILMETLSMRRRMSRSDLLALNLPIERREQGRYLNALRAWREEVEATRIEILDRERELDRSVGALYGLDQTDRTIIARFHRGFTPGRPRDAFEIAALMSPGHRSREEIDAALAEEREAWGEP